MEVALTSLRYDRVRKARLYAAAGIPEYWIVNLVDRQLEVFRQPTPDGYAECLTEAEDVRPLHAAGPPLRVTRPPAAAEVTALVAGDGVGGPGEPVGALAVAPRQRRS